MSDSDDDSEEGGGAGGGANDSLNMSKDETTLALENAMAKAKETVCAAKLAKAAAQNDSAKVVELDLSDDDDGGAMCPITSSTCPITHDVMKDPVILVETGQTYERAAIEEWLKTRHSCPSTGQELTHPPQLTTNYAMRSAAGASGGAGRRGGGDDDEEEVVDVGAKVVQVCVCVNENVGTTKSFDVRLGAPLRELMDAFAGKFKVEAKDEKWEIYGTTVDPAETLLTFYEETANLEFAEEFAVTCAAITKDGGKAITVKVRPNGKDGDQFEVKVRDEGR